MKNCCNIHLSGDIFKYQPTTSQIPLRPLGTYKCPRSPIFLLLLCLFISKPEDNID